MRSAQNILQVTQGQLVQHLLALQRALQDNVMLRWTGMSKQLPPNTVMCICAMHSSEYDTHNNTGSGEDQLVDEDTKLNYALAAFLNTTSWISSTPSWSGVGQR